MDKANLYGSFLLTLDLTDLQSKALAVNKLEELDGKLIYGIDKKYFIFDDGTVGLIDKQLPNQFIAMWNINSETITWDEKTYTHSLA